MMDDPIICCACTSFAKFEVDDSPKDSKSCNWKPVCTYHKIKYKALNSRPLRGR